MLGGKILNNKEFIIKKEVIELLICSGVIWFILKSNYQWKKAFLYCVILFSVIKIIINSYKVKEKSKIKATAIDKGVHKFSYEDIVTKKELMDRTFNITKYIIYLVSEDGTYRTKITIGENENPYEYLDKKFRVFINSKTSKVLLYKPDTPIEVVMGDIKDKEGLESFFNCLLIVLYIAIAILSFINIFL